MTTRTRAEEALIRLCEMGELEPGQGREFTVQGHHVMLLGTHKGVRAYRNSCPHQGRSLTFAPNEFLFSSKGLLVCPHHGASFETVTGLCTDGPCKGGSLQGLELVARGDELCIDPASLR